jgi:predicted DNA binding CopG/RHH family protein
MGRTQHAGTAIDDEERELLDVIEQDDFHPVSIATPEALSRYRAAAKAALGAAKVRISIDLLENDLAQLKARAAREGIPYQTLIDVILHEAAQD